MKQQRPDTPLNQTGYRISKFVHVLADDWSLTYLPTARLLCSLTINTVHTSFFWTLCGVK